MRILGIETSCDETGVAIYDSSQGSGIVANLLYSQINLHRDYGGVVPELASRDHIRKLVPMIHEAMKQASLGPADMDGIAYTRGPGLVGALLVGASLAKSLATAWQVPSLGIHHMEGHLLITQLAEPAPDYPFVALLVSGGHTQLMACHEPGRYELLGESLDDAAGEAFDKVARMLGLPYPGGPSVARLALEGRPGRFDFPRPMTTKPGLDFSFSGLKTFTKTVIESLNIQAAGPVAVGNDSFQQESQLASQHESRLDSQQESQLASLAQTQSESRQQDSLQQARADVAAAFQDAVVDTICIKCKRALEATGLHRLVVAGGVSANALLRERLASLARQAGTQVFYPAPHLCTDNGAMIAYAGYLRLMKGERESQSMEVKPRWPMTEL